MIIRFVGSPLETVIYLACVITSLLCAYLLARAYRRGRAKVLVWASLCFALLALNNLVLAVDILLLPENDLSILRIVTGLLAVGVLLCGFIWEAS
jgi:ABC-type glycerol-3-phosphate transport system permease component